MKKQLKLKYKAFNNYVNVIKPIKNVLPDWYKKTPMFTGKTPVIEDYSKNITLKACMPFFDSLMSGYVVTTWQDLQVKKDEQGFPRITWLVEPNPLTVRNAESSDKLPIPAGCNSTPFSWKLPTAIKTPKNYSLLALHPMNRFDLPFITLSAIIDAEKTLFSGNLPFFIKEDFEGIIPSGTPIMQLIPFKKENWKLEEDSTIQEEAAKNFFLTRTVLSGYYKKTQWRKVNYD